MEALGRVTPGLSTWRDLRGGVRGWLCGKSVSLACAGVRCTVVARAGWLLHGALVPARGSRDREGESGAWRSRALADRCHPKCPSNHRATQNKSMPVLGGGSGLVKEGGRPEPGGHLGLGMVCTALLTLAVAEGLSICVSLLWVTLSTLVPGLALQPSPGPLDAQRQLRGRPQAGWPRPEGLPLHPACSVQPSGSCWT